MKLVLLIVAGAFATQDVTPPVISLSFSDERYAFDGTYNGGTWNGICHSKDFDKAYDATCQALTTKANCEAETTKCSWTSGQTTNGHFQKALKTSHSSSASVMCYVDSNDDNCPDPTCTASDHHDTDVKCDDPTVVMIQRNLKTTKKYDETDKDMRSTHSDNTAYPDWAGSETNSATVNQAKSSTCVNAGEALTGKWVKGKSHKASEAKGYEGAETCVNRNTLGQYLVTYSARDRSGNEADKVSFSFLFVDPFVPKLNFGAGTPHGSTGYSNVMKFWPTKESTDVPSATASGAVYNTAWLDVEDTESNTWGAFYSAWSTVKQSGNDPFALVETKFTPAAEDTYDGSDYDSQEDRFNYASAQAPAGSDRFGNLEAGNCQGYYGGFISAVESGTEKIIGGKDGFCAAKASDAAYGTAFLSTACKSLNEVNCGTATACSWVAPCSRTTKDHWAYNVAVTPSDNYRQADQMSVQYKYYDASASWSNWLDVSASTTQEFCMRPGAPFVIDWIVSDEAGIFGFEHKDNIQTHRIQLTVTDNTRPVVYPVTYGSATTPKSQDITTFSATGQAAGGSSDFSWMTCAEMTQVNLCKGECEWTSGVCAARSGVDDSDGAYSCQDKVSGSGCSSATTQAACWTAASSTIGSCVWTRTAKLTRSTCDSSAECTDDTNCQTYENTDRSALSGVNAASVYASTTTQKKCRSKKSDTTPNSASATDTTIFLECGTAKPAAPATSSLDETKIAPDGKRGATASTYTEAGFLASDNWDNHNNDGSCFTGTKKGVAQEIHCVPTVTTPKATVTTSVGATSKGHCHIDNTQLAHTQNTDADYLQHTSDATSGATFLNDYLVAYKYTDANLNTAWPVTRRVVVIDTTPPTIITRGDCTIENSAGAHTNDNSDSTFTCIAASNGTHWNHDNRFSKQCAELATDAGCTGTDTSCAQCTGNCYWHRNSADTLNADGSINTSPSVGEGLFDHDRIAKFFDHRDNCDREVVTIVTLHEGGCTRPGTYPTGTPNCAGVKKDDTKKISCGTTSSPIDGSKCALDIFRWNGEEVHDQSHAGESIFVGGAYKQAFPEYEAGTYSVQYHTIDASGNTATACRVIENVDHTHPIIQILGSDQMTLEATHQGNYIDDGATCSDQVDGVISQNVEVSGDVVNLSKVGTYTITYNCKDSANNEAPAAQRTVVVAQTSCPKCTMYGKHADNSFDLTHEASFPYTDAGATCSDVIDGSITPVCSTDNSAYTGGETAAVCAQGSKLVDVETTGTYIVTYRAQNTVGLWNDDSNCRGGANTYKRTVTVVDTLKPVITLKYGGSNTIVAQGSSGEATNSNPSVDYPDATGSPYKTAWDTQHASNNPNNDNFDDPGDAHPSLMAEQTTSAVNGWVIGAFASAVAGLALLGYSTRRTTVATSVPV